MANQNQNGNGRNAALPDENRPSWRPPDQSPGTERAGQGQSGYGGGRVEGDRAWNTRNQQQQGGHQGNTDDRFSGRGGQGYHEDRGDRNLGHHEMGGDFDADLGRGDDYNSGYHQGAMGYGGYAPQPQDQGPQGFKGGAGGAQSYRDDSQGQGRTGYGPGGGYNEGGMGGAARNQGGRRGNSGTYGQGHQGMGHSQGQSFGQSGGQYGQQREQRGLGHRGKGPVGWQRTDERIKETICEMLHDDDDIDASRIEVHVEGGEVTLSGSVADRATKRAAEHLVERAPGVKDVHNTIRVQSAEPSRGNTRQQGNPPSAVAVTKNETESDKKHRA